MRKAELAMLEALFDAEITDPHGLLQKNNAALRSLESQGMAISTEVRMPSRQGCLVLLGYMITTRGHIAYCEYASTKPKGDPS